MAGIIFRRIFGVVALFFGVAILAWFLYNQFYPTPEFQRSYFGIFQLAVPIAFLYYGWRWVRYEGEGIESIPPTEEIPEVNESVIQAQATLSYFISQVEKNADNAYIKFPLTTTQGFKEHIWAYVHSYQDGSFNVSLANKPIDPKENAEGRRNVASKDVEDWQIMLPDRRIKGAYSMIALFRNRQKTGKPLSPKMKKQKALLVDMPQ